MNGPDLSEAEIIEKALQPLKRVYQNTLTPLVSAKVTRWDRDPFALGSTSALGTQFTLKDFYALASPEPKGLFFAGSHTLTHGNRETVHGAYLSGQRAALQISTFLKHQLKLDPHFKSTAAKATTKPKIKKL